MTIQQFLALFPVTKETKKGWDVCCPAHDDQHPSLGIMEGDDGRIVLNCFAGCAPRDICAALGLTVTDLFADRSMNGQVHPVEKAWKPLAPNKRAFAYELQALKFRQGAEKIFSAAGRCDTCDTWTDEDRELAMQAVSRAYEYQDRAAFCEDYADHLREQEWRRTHVAS